MANGSSVVPFQQDQHSDWGWDGSQWVQGCDCGDGNWQQGPNRPPPWWSGPVPPWYPGANAGVSFGTSAPPHPIRGHFWWNGTELQMFDGAGWIVVGGAAFDGGGGGASGAGTVIINTQAPGNPAVGSQWWNGSQLQTWDGTAWRVIGPGQAAGPVPTTTQTFSLTQAAMITLPAATWGVTPLTATPGIDVQLAWDPVTHRLTPTKAGVYLFIIRGWVTASGGGWAGILLPKNDTGAYTGNEHIIASSQFGGGPSSDVLSAMGLSVMNGSTDFVRLFSYSTSGGPVFSSQSYPAIEAWLLP